jgi:hypothetical protein
MFLFASLNDRTFTSPRQALCAYNVLNYLLTTQRSWQLSGYSRLSKPYASLRLHGRVFAIFTSPLFPIKVVRVNETTVDGGEHRGYFELATIYGH